MVALVYGQVDGIDVQNTFAPCMKVHDNTVLGYTMPLLQMQYDDVAVVIPRFDIPLVLNSLDYIVPVHFERWFDEVLPRDSQTLSQMTVVKRGISSGTTSGRIVNTSREYLIVEGLQVTPFFMPGDSGSLVFDSQNGMIIGIVAEIEYLELSGGIYCTKVIPVWMFYDWLMDEVVSVVYEKIVIKLSICVSGYLCVSDLSVLKHFCTHFLTKNLTRQTLPQITMI
jgi:hypothetical protein